MFALLSFPATAQVRITEFMASNSINLLNRALTDGAGNPGKWRFPATNIPPQSFMIVFASGKDRAIPGQELHTNFKLSAPGEYLAMSVPAGSVATKPGEPQLHAPIHWQSAWHQLDHADQPT